MNPGTNEYGDPPSQRRHLAASFQVEPSRPALTVTLATPSNTVDENDREIHCQDPCSPPRQAAVALQNTQPSRRAAARRHQPFVAVHDQAARNVGAAEGTLTRRSSRRVTCRISLQLALLALSHSVRTGSRSGHERWLLELGRAHVCTPVTVRNLVCRLLLE